MSCYPSVTSISYSTPLPWPSQSVVSMSVLASTCSVLRQVSSSRPWKSSMLKAEHLGGQSFFLSIRRFFIPLQPGHMSREMVFNFSISCLFIHIMSSPPAPAPVLMNSSRSVQTWSVVLFFPHPLTQMSILVMHMMQMQMRIRSLVLVRRFADVFWLVLRPPQAAINAYMMISLSLLVEMSILTVPRPCSPVFVSLIMLRLPRKKEPRIELMSVVMRTPG